MSRRVGAPKRIPIIRWSVEEVRQALKNGAKLEKYTGGHAEVIINGAAVGFLTRSQVAQLYGQAKAH